MNTFGRILRVSLFGESHGHGVGCVLDGVPAGLRFDEDHIQRRMDERRPGTSNKVSARQEPDVVRILAGTYEGHTTGAPVLLMIQNQDARSQDYEDSHLARPGHADYPEHVATDGHRDPRGGGHRSGRLTAPLVAAAALLHPFLQHEGIRVRSHLEQVGEVHGEDAMAARIEEARRERDSIGGVVGFVADGVPAGWGDPAADALDARLAHDLMAIPGAKAVAIGEGFEAATMAGSHHNDAYRPGPVTTTNHAGGILGGRSTGMPVWGRVAFKPTSSIARPQETIDLRTGKAATLHLGGRHDPCIAVRAVPVVQAVIELALVDMALLSRMQ